MNGNYSSSPEEASPTGRPDRNPACALLVYYGIPLHWGEGPNRVDDAIGLIVFVVGVGGPTWLIRWQIRRYVASSSTMGGQVQGLLAVLYVVVVFLFSYSLSLLEAERQWLITRVQVPDVKQD